MVSLNKDSCSQQTYAQLLERLNDLVEEEKLIVAELRHIAAAATNSGANSGDSPTTSSSLTLEERFAHMKGSVLFCGDVVSPAADPAAWEANQ